MRTRLMLLPVFTTLVATPAFADIAVVSNDGRLTLVDGVQTVVPSPKPDTVTVLDLAGAQPKVLFTVEAPGSAVGPPFSVAVSPDEKFALVAAPLKLDPADATKQVADNRVSVLDIAQKKVVQTATAGKSPSGLSFNKEGNLVLVANRGDGTVSVFSFAGGQLSPVGVVKVGDEKSGPSHVAIAGDGKSALVTRDGDHNIAVLAIDGANVTLTGRLARSGIRPYSIDIAPRGDVAIVGDLGTSSGDNNTVSILDLQHGPAHVVNTIMVGQTPEGLKLSPDGKLLAVAVNNGSNLSPKSPFYVDHGLLQIWRRNGTQLTKITEAPIGRWSQGVAWSANGKTLVTQSMLDKVIQPFAFDGKALKALPPIQLEIGSAAIRTAAH
jgi:DNA-binding beta-propeller fold protein YncE